MVPPMGGALFSAVPAPLAGPGQPFLATLCVQCCTECPTDLVSWNPEAVP